GTPSYSAVWDTRTVPDGAYVIAARARDAAGNVASSAPVQVTVNNGGGLPTATPTATPTVTPTPAPINGRLGNTNVGVTIDSGDSNAMNGSRVTTGAQPITVRSISVFVAGIDSSTANRSYQVAIFSDNTGRPGTLVASSATGTLSANSWNTLPISGANLAANSSYWLMYNTNGRTSALNNMRRDDGVPGTGAYSAGAVPFGTWPSNFGTSVTGVWSWSIYLTF
ncbi:MAG TPA: choice-of-anchor R domain-containing protein, partial [Chloroflexota bacterium]|nr:choice-of-anchor R domain-containing protein [Chloroflexota bacterium]